MLSSNYATKFLRVSVFIKIILRMPKPIVSKSQRKKKQKTTHSSESSCVIDLGMPYAAV